MTNSFKIVEVGESKRKNETTVALLAGLTWLCSLLHTLCVSILTTLSRDGSLSQRLRTPTGS